jgi:hypothetical protein
LRSLSVGGGAGLDTGFEGRDYVIQLLNGGLPLLGSSAKQLAPVANFSILQSVSSTGFGDLEVGRHGLTEGLKVVLVGLFVALAQAAFQKYSSDLAVEAVLCHLLACDPLLEVLAEADRLTSDHGLASVLEVALAYLIRLLAFLWAVGLAGRHLSLCGGSCWRLSLSNLRNVESVGGESADVLVQLGAALSLRLGDSVCG